MFPPTQHVMATPKRRRAKIRRNRKKVNAIPREREVRAAAEKRAAKQERTDPGKGKDLWD